MVRNDEQQRRGPIFAVLGAGEKEVDSDSVTAVDILVRSAQSNVGPFAIPYERISIHVDNAVTPMSMAANLVSKSYLLESF